MNRITKAILFFVVLAVVVISVKQSASACAVSAFYHTKEGVLAASTQETLSAAIKFAEEGNQEKLADLMKDGSVLRLTANIKVQVLERSFEFKSLKIQLPEGNVTYWVIDGSLVPLGCK